MFGSWGAPNTLGTYSPSTSTGQNNGEQPPSYNQSFKNITIAKGPNNGSNSGPNNGSNNGKKKKFTRK